MLDPNSSNIELPAIPGKRYFTIGEVSELCRSSRTCCATGSRSSRSSSRSSVVATAVTTSATTSMMIRQIRSLLYEQGFTIGGARQQLAAGDSVKTSDRHEGQQPRIEAIRELRGELEEVLAILNS